MKHGNLKREAEELERNLKELLELKSTITDVKNPWEAHLTKKKKGSENLRHGRETHPIRAAKRKKNAKW